MARNWNLLLQRFLTTVGFLIFVQLQISVKALVQLLYYCRKTCKLQVKTCMLQRMLSQLHCQKLASCNKKGVLVLMHRCQERERKRVDPLLISISSQQKSCALYTHLWMAATNCSFEYLCASTFTYANEPATILQVLRKSCSVVAEFCGSCDRFNLQLACCMFMAVVIAL